MITIDDTQIGNLRMAEMIKSHELEKETIFFCDFQRDDSEEIIKQLFDMRFQIGSHTKYHPDLRLLNDGQLEFELVSSKKEIERITGVECKWFAYPYSHYDDRVKKAVEQAGYKYARICRKETKDNFEIGCFEMSGKHWGEAMKKKYPIYQIHYYNLERNNSFEEFEKFLEWYEKK